MEARTVKADILLMLTAAIWGCAFVAQRVGMDYVGPFTFNGVRFALGALALVPLIQRMDAGRNARGVLERASFKKLLFGGSLLGVALFAGSTLQQVGIVYTTAGKAGFITGLYVVIVPLLGLFFRQRTGWGTWLGVALAVVGMYLLSGQGLVTLATEESLGDLLVFIGAFFWAGHVLLIGWLSPGMDPTDAVKLSSVQFAACSVLSMATAFVVEDVTAAGIWAAGLPILYGGVMSVGVAYTLQVVAQRDAKPAHAAVILSLESVWAAFAGWLMLGETLGTAGLVGCGLMLAGMLVSQLRQ